MERLMSNPKVVKAMVRLALTVLDSSPSTACLLDQLPLSPQDVRMVFDIFVGSNGQIMLKTIAGLVSDLTTGPDTKKFLESALGMMSMFKSDDPGATTKNSDKPAESIVGSLTNFFTGGDLEEEEVIDDIRNSAPPPEVNNRKKNSPVSGTVSKPSMKKPKKDVDPWFSNTGSSFESLAKKSKSNEDPWFSRGGTASSPFQKKTAPPKLNNWFKSSTNSGKGKVSRDGETVSDKNNYSNLEVVTEKSGSASFSDNDDTSKIAAKPVDVKTKTKIVAKKPVIKEVDDFDSGEYD
uniref:Uncharacterized protein n=1 Tax=Schizaphis graminum TaxID=13262 RepID=A0A2S2NUY3_SCHGA